MQIKDVTGQPITDLKECVTDHLERLYRSNNEISMCNSTQDWWTRRRIAGGLRWELMPCTVDRTIPHIRTQTASGQDGISACPVKSLDPNSREQLADLFTGILTSMAIPSDWHQGRMSLILKCRGKADMGR